jgi:RNA polymerase sigma-70 factor (ECF subfamily)
MSDKAFEKLIEKLAQGSEEAAHELSANYAPRMLEEIRKHLSPKIRSKFDSTDFLQDVWASFFATPKGKRVFTRPEELMAFLKRMAKNKVIDGVRQRTTQKRNIRLEQSIDDSRVFDKSALPGQQATPSQIIMNQEEWTEFLRKQPPVYRRMFILLREGKSQLEIAEELQVNPRTVSRVIHERLPGTSR